MDARTAKDGMLNQCDEEGPPCGNCYVRGLEDCSLPHSQSATPQDASSAGSPNKTASSVVSESLHKLELELMHRWATSTYKSLCTIPEDEQWLRDGVPRWGLKHEFLLHGVFSISALEIALCDNKATVDDTKIYFKHALEYYDRASRAYRAELANITPANLKGVFVFSSIAVLINMAIPQCERLVGGDESQDILGRMIALFHLLQKASHIVINNLEALMSDPEAAPAIKAGLEALHTAPSKPLCRDVETALSRANTIVEASIPIPTEEADATAQEEALSRLHSHRVTVSALRMCFVEDSKEMIKGLAIAFPSLSGPNFAVELKRSEPVAMFLMMHWGVLLHHLGQIIWWAKTIGRRLVLEISEILLQTQSETELGGLTEWLDGIAWAKREVGELNDDNNMNRP
ncbi:hypothetical protein BGZ63DRAFT_39728 [Mariannaea sp. PMI_226]|nr:hypothetical protein BGZ63DRAFT_39728 [Mariannaea sp. PMI_226]